MTRIKGFVVCLVMATLCAAASGQTPTASELLQKGIYLEETVGDLEGAMRTYKQVTQMAAESRASAAQAEYRMGVCLQKKGQQAEAINTFRSLIKDYPEQADVVAKAKESLPAEPQPGNPCQGLEDEIQQHPEDRVLREKTVSCYWWAQAKNTFDSPKGKELEKNRIEHVLWLIRLVPDEDFVGTYLATFCAVPEDYLKLRRAWMQQVEIHPDDANVLANVARFMGPDDKEKAEELVVRARKLDPANLRVARRLAEIREQKMRDPDTDAMVPGFKTQMAQQALQLREQIWNSTTQASEFVGANLHSLAFDAFEAGEYVKARKYAEQLSLRADSGSIHHGNVLLGRLDLKSGDVDAAKKHLLLAAKVSGPGPLETFGPNTMLARELLLKGEQDVVLQYFDECQKF